MSIHLTLCHSLSLCSDFLSFFFLYLFIFSLSLSLCSCLSLLLSTPYHFLHSRVEEEASHPALDPKRPTEQRTLQPIRTCNPPQNSSPQWFQPIRETPRWDSFPHVTLPHLSSSYQTYLTLHYITLPYPPLHRCPLSFEAYIVISFMLTPSHSLYTRPLLFVYFIWFCCDWNGDISVRYMAPCTVQYRILLCCTILYWTIEYYTILHRTALDYTASYSSMLLGQC